MKNKYLHIVFIWFLGLSLFAQNEYKPFKVDIGLLWGEVHKHDIGLISPYVEPKYNINKHFSVGLRLEYFFYKKDGFIDYDPNNPYLSDLDAAGWNLSTVATVDYYFNTNFIRPFIGIGAGAYFMYIDKENTYIESITEKGVAFGYVPRIGFNVGQFRIACEYNFINSKNFDLDYFALKIGYEIGGGKKHF